MEDLGEVEQESSMADLDAVQLQFISLLEIIRASVRIPYTSSPRRFILITLTLILPLTIVQLLINDHHQILDRILDYFMNPTDETHKDLILAFIYEFFSIIFLLIFSLLSTAAIVFTVASLYASLPVTFIPTLYAIPRVLRRLFVTFLYFFVLKILYNSAFFVLILLTIGLNFMIQNTNKLLFIMLSFCVMLLIFNIFHGYVTALWLLAGVISVLERDVSGLAAMRMSKRLMRGKTITGLELVLIYFVVAWGIQIVFRVVVVDPDPGYNWMIRVLVGFLCVVILVAVNLIGFLVQSVFYHVCKSFHHQEIDKRVLYEHLGGYLGEQSEPLRRTAGMIELPSINKRDAVDEEEDDDDDDDLAGDVDNGGSYVGPTSD